MLKRTAKSVKILAMYLPQYHEVPENSEFWGKGFTDWVTVKNAIALYDGHLQPQEPLDDFYYDLSKKESIQWQIGLAKKYGIYGFGIYHYWFSSEKVLLTKPAELLMEDRGLEIPFFFAWDNVSWRRTWSKVQGNAWSPLMDSRREDRKDKDPVTLVEYQLGDESEWKKHFDYLFPYFQDSRYIKADGMPLFLVYHYSDKLCEMASYWNQLAVKNGLHGVRIVYRHDPVHVPGSNTTFAYEPAYSGWGSIVSRTIAKLMNRGEEGEGLHRYSYDRVWRTLLRNARRSRSDNRWHGAFVSYDDTPRRGNRGKVIMGATPEKFSGYMAQLLKICMEQRKEYVFLTAWNEWGEGAYLEPDKHMKYGYLEALRKALLITDNLE